MKNYILILLLLPLLGFGQVFLSNYQKKHKDIKSQSSFENSKEVFYEDELRIVLGDSTYYIELPNDKKIEGLYDLEKTKYGDVYRFREGGNMSYTDEGLTANLYSRDEVNGFITFYTEKSAYDKEKAKDDSIWIEREYKSNERLWGAEVASCMKNKTPCIGMTEIQVLLTIGSPNKKSSIETNKSYTESHHYDNLIVIYKNGRVHSIYKH